MVRTFRVALDLPNEVTVETAAIWIYEALTDRLPGPGMFASVQVDWPVVAVGRTGAAVRIGVNNGQTRTTKRPDAPQTAD